MYKENVYGEIVGKVEATQEISVPTEQPKIQVAIDYLQGQVENSQSLSRRILVALVGLRPIVTSETNQKEANLSDMICSQGQELEETNQRLEEVLHIIYTNLGENIKLE